MVRGRRSPGNVYDEDKVSVLVEGWDCRVKNRGNGVEEL